MKKSKSVAETIHSELIESERIRQYSIDNCTHYNVCIYEASKKEKKLIGPYIALCYNCSKREVSTFEMWVLYKKFHPDYNGE